MRTQKIFFRGLTKSRFYLGLEPLVLEGGVSVQRFDVMIDVSLVKVLTGLNPAIQVVRIPIRLHRKHTFV